MNLHRVRPKVVVVLAAVLILPAGPDRSGAQTTPSLLPPNLIAFINGASRDIDRFWAARLQNYRPPADVVMVQAPAMTDCGALDQPNAFYCPGTHKIYWDVTFFASQYRLGDFAPVFILAHEWGHLVQRQLGLLDTASGLLPIQQELQADCLAGWYAHDAAQRKILDPGDDDEAVLSLRRAGDKLDSPWFDAEAHGSSGLRIDAFTYGFEGRTCTTDAFWAFLRQRGVDSSRAPQVPTPGAGRLEQLLPRSIGRLGRFEMVDVARVQVGGATDALKARYRTLNSKGPHVEVAVMAFPTADRARSQLDAEVRALIAAGLHEVRRTRLMDKQRPSVEIGVGVVFQGELEYIVWSHQQVVGIVEGPFNVAFEFYTALPF